MNNTGHPSLMASVMGLLLLNTQCRVGAFRGPIGRDLLFRLVRVISPTGLLV